MKTMQAETRAVQAEYKTDVALLAKAIAERDRNIILAVVSVMLFGIAILRFTD